MFRTRPLMPAALLLVTGAFIIATALWGLPHLLRPSAPETGPVVVTAQDVPPYTVLTADMVKTRDLPRDQVPPGALTKVEDALDRAALTPLVKGEILLNAKLAPVRANRGTRIQPGMLAFTIPGHSVAAGLADFIQPGNRVDVVQTAAGRGRSKGTGAAPLLRGMRVLAVELPDWRAPVRSDLLGFGASVVGLPGSPSGQGPLLAVPALVFGSALRSVSVTLLVSPEQVEKLNRAEEEGRLRLVPHPPGEPSDSQW